MYITKKVRAMEPPRYTKEDVAEIIGVSVSTIKRWKEKGVFVPMESRVFGSFTVDLYTPEDIPILEAIKATSKPGRKPASAQED